MSTKNYIVIAATIKAEFATANTFATPYRDGARDGVSNLAYSLADYFKQDNPNFDRAKFIVACGL